MKIIRRRYRRLTTHLLVMISLSSILAVALIGGLYFNYTYQHEMQQTVQQLKVQSLSRIERERWPFIQAEQNTQLLAEAFTDIYQRSHFADLLPYYGAVGRSHGRHPPLAPRLGPWADGWAAHHS